MLREEGVSYASLPQDEGITPRSSFITTRSAPNYHGQRDCKIATILTIGVIITGLGLAATLPFVLRDTLTKPPDTPNPDEDNNDPGFIAHLSGGEHLSATVDDIGSTNTNTHEDSQVVVADNARTEDSGHELITTPEDPDPPKPSASEPSYDSQNLKPKPVLVYDESDKITTQNNTNTGSQSETTNEELISPSGQESGLAHSGNNDSVTEDVATEKSKDFFDNWFDLKGDDDDDVENGSQEDEEEAIVTTQKAPPTPPSPRPDINIPDTHHNVDLDMNQLLNEIYGDEGNSQSGYADNDSKMVTLVVLAAVVALALASVIAAVAWLVYSRLAARRRRINIQNVITDLQSRDKVVLLNSESDED